MKKSLFRAVTLVLSCCVFSSSFIVSANEDTARLKEQYSREAFHEQLLEYQSLVEEALVWRTQAVDFIQELKQESVYSSEQLATIHRGGTIRYRNIRERILENAKAYRWITDSDTTVSLTDKTTSVRSNGQWWNPLDNDDKLIEVNPAEEMGQYHIKAAKLSLASALILYDNYIVAIGEFQELQTRYPWSYYAYLAERRLEAWGVDSATPPPPSPPAAS